MPRKKHLKHYQKLGFKSWLMIGGLIVLVGLLLLVTKLKTPQDIRQKATGSDCFLAVKDKVGSEVEIVKGSGGKQQIGGAIYCVGGVGNDADRYNSFYTSKIIGQMNLKSQSYPCQNESIAKYKVGDSCEVDGKKGKIICVGGPAQEYIGCISNDDEQQFYQRLTTQKLDQSNSITPTSQPTKVVERQPTRWQDIIITIKASFEPHSVLDPTQEKKNQWPWLVLFINNGADLFGSYDRANCGQDLSSEEYPSQFSCGSPNQYLDRLWDNFEVKANKGQSKVVKQWQVRAGDLIKSVDSSQTRFMTKLSFVFYNGYWNGDEASREVGIEFIEFYSPDGRLIKRYTPKNSSFWLEKKKNWNLKHSFYFDLGRVSNQAEANTFQDGFVYAFDKKRVEDIKTNQSQQNNYWLLDEEGSFNLVTEELIKPIRQFWKNKD